MRRAAAWLLLAGIFFLGLREIASLGPHPVDAPMTARTVFVVGVTDRQQLTPLDMDVLDSYSTSVQFGPISTRARHIGDCAAAGWGQRTISAQMGSGHAREEMVLAPRTQRRTRGSLLSAAVWVGADSFADTMGPPTMRQAPVGCEGR